MIPLSPVLLIATANAFLGLGGGRLGEELGALFRREVADEAAPHGAPRRWDLAFVHHVGYWSHYDGRGDASSWPLPLTDDVDALAAFATARGIMDTEPQVGDLFLLWSVLRARYCRVGIVLALTEEESGRDGRRCRVAVTVEGDAAHDGTGGGGLVLRHTRRLSAADGDRFIRWPLLDERHLAAGDVGHSAEAIGLVIARQSERRVA